MHAIENTYTGEESLEEVSEQTNETVELESPDFEQLRDKLFHLIIGRTFELFKSLDKALRFAHKHVIPPEDGVSNDEIINATLILCQLGRRVGVYHTSYQQTYMRVHEEFDDEVRALVREALLF